MAIPTYTSIATHAAGDSLPVADWNAAVTQLNQNLTLVNTRGLVTSTTSNGSPPYYMFAGAFNLTTNSTGIISITQTAGSSGSGTYAGFPGFPNGVISSQLTLHSGNSTGSYAQAGWVGYTNSTYTSNTNLAFQFYDTAASGRSLNSTIVQFSVLAIGY